MFARGVRVSHFRASVGPLPATAPQLSSIYKAACQPTYFSFSHLDLCMRRHLVPHRHPGHRPAPGWSNLVWRLGIQAGRFFFRPSRFGLLFFSFGLWDLLALAGLVQVTPWASFASETFLGEPLFVFFAKSCTTEGDSCLLVGPEDASSHFSNYYSVGVRLSGWPFQHA